MSLELLSGPKSGLGFLAQERLIEASCASQALDLALVTAITRRIVGIPLALSRKRANIQDHHRGTPTEGQQEAGRGKRLHSCRYTASNGSPEQLACSRAITAHRLPRKRESFFAKEVNSSARKGNDFCVYNAASRCQELYQFNAKRVRGGAVWMALSEHRLSATNVQSSSQ